MKNKEFIDINEFDYALTDNKIAKYPLKQRDASKLLVYKDNKISEQSFHSITEILPQNTCLVFNETKVIQARLLFKKETGAQIEVFCLNPCQPAEYYQAFQVKNTCQWICIIGNKKKWKDGLIHAETTNKEFTLQAKLIDRENNIVQFNWDDNKTFGEILEMFGSTPIPPYLNRASEESDTNTYQTVYAKNKGSVAAPTAGLHFTGEVFNKLSQKGIETAKLTLHVGAGTFQPVKSTNATEHEMHEETFIVDKKLLTSLINHNNIIAIGTTSLRTLESLYWIGVKHLENKSSSITSLSQWEYKTLPGRYTFKQVIKGILEYLNNSGLEYFSASTSIMITPGYDIKSIDALITNFHQPKSTLLLLVSALIGENWKKVYQYALENKFRFLSYGDSSILFKPKN